MKDRKKLKSVLTMVITFVLFLCGVFWTYAAEVPATTEAPATSDIQTEVTEVPPTTQGGEDITEEPEKDQPVTQPETEPSTEPSAKPVKVDTPQNLSAKNYDNKILFEWNSVENAKTYIVYRKDASNKSWVKTAEVSSVSFKDGNIKNGTEYTYTVKAVSESGTVSGHLAGVKCIALKKPADFKVSCISEGMKISWGKVSTATGYKLYRKVAGDTKWTKIATLKSNSVTEYTDKNVSSGKEYTYTVKQYKGSIDGSYELNGKKSVYLSTPKNLTADNSNNSIVFKWSAVSGAVKYRVYRKDTTNKSWTRLGETASLKYTDNTVKNGVEYTYTVRAISRSDSISSYLSGVKCTALKNVSGFSVYNTTGGVKISWNKASSATGYRVYRKASGETDWTLISKIGGNSTVTYTDKKVSAGKTYTYTVKQMKNSLHGSYDKNGLTVKYVSAPTLTAEHSPKGIVLKWNKCALGNGYEVQRKASGESSWKTVKTVSKLSTVTYTDKTPVYGKKNYYRIKVTGAGATTVSAYQYLYGIDPNKPMVALTYDDGPYTPVTNSILDTLEKYSGRATFFVVGSRVSAYSACIKREAALGCEIGNHTYNHTILTKVSTSKILSEINNTNSDVKKYTGTAPVLVRAPGGSVNSTVKSTVKYPLINWSVDTLDWKNRNSSSVVSNIKKNVKDGSIVLMHDLYSSTASATETIVPWLVKNGYQLVTVSEMMAVKGIDMKNGTVYTKG